MRADAGESSPAAASAPASASVLGAAALLLVTVALAVSIGTEPTSLSNAFFDAASSDRAYVATRLPHVLLAALAGAGLGTVGLAFQAVLRNPLAEPFVLGVSGGSALGATVAILLGVSGATLLGASIVPLAALVGGIGATAVVYAMVRSGRGVDGTSILLAGVVVNSIAGAAITFLKTLVSASKTQEVLYWLVGFLGDPWWHELGFVALYTFAGLAILFADAGRLNLLALGDESAATLGLDVESLVRRTFFACSLVVGAIVSVTGLIGFIGLIVPHAVRRIVGPDLRIALPTTFFAGGAVLVACDLVSRVLLRWLGTEPPVGAVTALIGGPLFLLLLRKSETV